MIMWLIDSMWLLNRLWSGARLVQDLTYLISSVLHSRSLGSWTVIRTNLLVLMSHFNRCKSSIFTGSAGNALVHKEFDISQYEEPCLTSLLCICLTSLLCM